MTLAAGADPRIDSFLSRVRAALRGLPDGEIEDILLELRSHVVDLAKGNAERIETALHSLGDPVDLAKTYRAENEVAHAECSASTLAILQGLRHASHSRLGRFTASVLYVFCYINVVTLWLAAFDKLVWPSRTGLWYTPGDMWSLTLVHNGNPPVGASELLGWWLVPIALLVGWTLRYVTDRIAQWWIRRYRQSKVPQA